MRGIGLSHEMSRGRAHRNLGQVRLAPKAKWLLGGSEWGDGPKPVVPALAPDLISGRLRLASQVRESATGPQ